MLIVERVAIGAFGLIALYLIANSTQMSQVISSIGANAGGLFGTLQGRNVSFGQGVSVQGGPLSGPAYGGGY